MNLTTMMTMMARMIQDDMRILMTKKESERWTNEHDNHDDHGYKYDDDNEDL